MASNDVLDKAFDDQPKLKEMVKKAISQTPQHTKLFTELSNYIISLKTAGGDGPAAKKRKIETEGLTIREGPPPTPTTASASGQANAAPSATNLDWAQKESPLVKLGDFSFASPGRKKLSVELTENGILGRSPAAGTIECGVKYAEIDRVICVAVPEKVQPHFNFIIFPFGSDGAIPPTQPGGPEPILFTIPDGGPKNPTDSGFASTGQGTYKLVVTSIFNSKLGPGRSVIEPTPTEFVSAIVQAHRKDEKAYFVKAHRGAKDGFLYLLPSGILFGFRKPLLFYSFASINSVSYTSVLQRTFNLNIITPDGEETEFAMLDQTDFEGIDRYIKRHGLNDASMAEQRRAKILNINGKRGADGEEDEEGQGESEISRVMREEGVDLEPDDDGLPKVKSMKGSISAQSTPRKGAAANGTSKGKTTIKSGAAVSQMPKLFSIHGEEEDDEEDEEDYDPGEDDDDDGGSGDSDEDSDDDDDDEDDEDDEDMDDD